MTQPAYENWAREILRCPVGLHPLVDVVDESGAPALQCDQDCGAPGQRRRYPLTPEGIPTLLVDEATVVQVAAGHPGEHDTPEPSAGN